jgi:hypothetical protein
MNAEHVSLIGAEPCAHETLPDDIQALHVAGDPLFDPNTFKRHCAGIIAAEIDRRDLTVRALYRDGIIRKRSGFRERLEKGVLNYAEVERLLNFLEIDAQRLFATYGIEHSCEAYRSPIFASIAQILSSFATIWNSRGRQLHDIVEPMRPSICDAVAERLFEKMKMHYQRVEMARENFRDF